MALAHPEPRPEFEPLPVPLAPEAWMEKALPGAREEGAPLGWPSPSQALLLLSFMAEARHSLAERTNLPGRDGWGADLPSRGLPALFVWSCHPRLNKHLTPLLSPGPFPETQPLAETSPLLRPAHRPNLCWVFPRDPQLCLWLPKCPQLPPSYWTDDITAPPWLILPLPGDHSCQVPSPITVCPSLCLLFSHTQTHCLTS